MVAAEKHSRTANALVGETETFRLKVCGMKTEGLLVPHHLRPLSKRKGYY